MRHRTRARRSLGATSAPVIAAAGSGVLVVAYQNQATNQKAHVYVASSINSGATWTYTHARIDQGTGNALAPQSFGSIVGGEPAAVSVWTDFRSGTGISGDVYSVVSH